MTAGWSLRRPAVAAALVPLVALAVTPAAGWLALLVATVAVAGGLHGLGRGVGRGVGADDAPVALAIAWGTAVAIVVGAALSAAGAWTAAVRTGLLVAGAGLGVAWAARPPARAADAARAPGRALDGARGGAAWVAPGLIAAVAVLAVLGAAGDRHVTADHHGAGAVAVLAGFASRVAASPHLIDDGWGFALTASLIVAALPAGAGLARIATVLLAAAVPLDGHDLAARWIVVALVLAAWTSARPDGAVAGGRRRLALVGALAALAVAVALVATAPRHAAISLALGLALAAVGHGLADEPAAATSLAGAARGRRGLVAVAAAVAVVLGLIGVRARSGTPPTSWPERLARRIDAAAAVGELPPAR